MEPLTKRQNEAYEFIRSYQRSTGKPPTMKEIAGALGVRSTNAVHKLLERLQRKGYIRREKQTARGIELLAEEAGPFSDESTPSLPVISRAAGDHPKDPRLRPAGYITVDQRLLPEAGNPETCLVGRAMDDGMSGEGIRRGDLLVLEEMTAESLSPGSLVGAFLRGDFVVRRYQPQASSFTLRTANRTYPNERFDSGQPNCSLVGRVHALIRLY